MEEYDFGILICGRCWELSKQDWHEVFSIVFRVDIATYFVSLELQDLKLLTPMNSSKQSFEQERFVAGLSVDGKLTIWTIVRAFNSWEYVKVSELELKVFSFRIDKYPIPTFAFEGTDKELGIDFWICWDQRPSRSRNAHNLDKRWDDLRLWCFSIISRRQTVSPFSNSMEKHIKVDSVLLIGILPSVKANFIAVFAGVKRGSFTIASISSLHSGVRSLLNSIRGPTWAL